MSSSPRYDFSLNPQAPARLHSVGNEREPLLQIDGLLRSPDSLIDFAATEGQFAPAYGPDGGYPGLRADAPLDYVRAVVQALDATVRQAFSLGAVKLGRAECSLSLVTLTAANGDHKVRLSLANRPVCNRRGSPPWSQPRPAGPRPCSKPAM